MEATHDQEQELQHLDLFQKQLTDQFSNLLLSPPFLSISFLRTLLNAFLCIETQFKALLLTNPNLSQFSKPPLDRSLLDLLDRLVKSLDICNALSLGLDSIHNIQNLAQIALSSLQQTPLGDGQARRANKALHSLISAINADDKDVSSPAKSVDVCTWFLFCYNKSLV